MTTLLEPPAATSAPDETAKTMIDINLHGEFSFAIADVLRTRNIPFVFVTGYRDLSIVPCALRTAPRLDKPVNDDRLIESVSELFRARVG